MTSNPPPLPRVSRLYQSLCLGLVLIALCGRTIGGIRFNLEPTTRVVQSSAAIKSANESLALYGGSTVFRLGDGLIPRGTASVVLGDGSDAKSLAAAEIEIQVAKPKQLFNNSIDYDSFQLIYKDQAYDLDTDDEVFSRLVGFVDRGKYILFTWPDADDEEAIRLLRDEGLVRSPHPTDKYGDPNRFGRYQYIANEFASLDYFKLLNWIDIHAVVKELPANTSSTILNALQSHHIAVDAYLEWINADFHVNYLVMLLDESGQRRVDIAGAPLRYEWGSEKAGSLYVKKLKIFAQQPNLKKGDLQYRAIALFQAAALLRQFRSDNQSAFRRLAKQVEGSRPAPKSAQ